MIMRFKKPLFWIKWTHFEYWNWIFFYLPLLPYWLYLAIKNRNLAYVTLVNPCIELGGFFGESKIRILQQIPKKYIPKTIFIPLKWTIEEISQKMELDGMEFPIVAKPNVGERGTYVERLSEFSGLVTYKEKSTADFIIQEFIEYPIELGVLYYRMPFESKGFISSITLKEFLSVTGDGHSTILSLLEKNDRARFQLKKWKKQRKQALYEVLSAGEVRIMEPIGNHCRGTKFINANHLINDKVQGVFNTIALPIEGFYYGRFDLKVKSWEDLEAGTNIGIMELNGVSSEPGHIYDPANSLINAYKDLAWHWNLLSKISQQNKVLGIRPTPFSILAKETWKHFTRPTA